MAYKRLFDEGINDKNLFKCIFTAGGPGSGKSYISSLMFGVGKVGTISPFGIKVINSDVFFEKLLNKVNMSLIIDVKNQDLYKKQMEVRDLSKALASSKLAQYIDGMLPIIIDGTGKRYDKISDQAEALRRIGYDVSMVFVNTTLDVALERNEKRKRSVDEELVIAMWKAVQKNIGKFQNFFGSRNFVIIDNSNYLEPGSAEAKKFVNDLFMKGKKLVEAPLQNLVGRKVIELLKASGGKYLHDLGKSIEPIKV